MSNTFGEILRKLLILSYQKQDAISPLIWTAWANTIWRPWRISYHWNSRASQFINMQIAIPRPLCQDRASSNLYVLVTHTAKSIISLSFLGGRAYKAWMSWKCLLYAECDLWVDDAQLLETYCEFMCIHTTI